MAKIGQMFDANLASVPTQRNCCEENQQIKAGIELEDCSIQKRWQKGTAGQWTKKSWKNYFGYKNHISVVVMYKLIRSYAVSTADVHDIKYLKNYLTLQAPAGMYGLMPIGPRSRYTFYK